MSDAPEISDEQLLRLGDELYCKYKREGCLGTTEIITCDGSTTAAAEYLSLIAFPNDKQARERFIKAADWLYVKTNHKLTKKQKQEAIKKLEKNNYRNAEQIFRRGIENTSKAIKAWHSHKTVIDHEAFLDESISLSAAFEKVAEAYPDKAGRVKYEDHDDFRKNVYRPYAGVIHLVDGFHEAFLCRIKLKSDRHLRIAIENPLWVAPAIRQAHISLKAMLIESHLRHKGFGSSKQKALLPLNKVIDISGIVF